MKTKLKTSEQIETAQARAIRAAENLLDDPDLADELSSLSLGEYAERRGWQIANNPSIKENSVMPTQTKEQLLQRLENLESENEELISENQFLSEQLDTVRSIASDALDPDDEESDEEDED